MSNSQSERAFLFQCKLITTKFAINRNIASPIFFLRTLYWRKFNIVEHFYTFTVLQCESLIFPSSIQKIQAYSEVPSQYWANCHSVRALFVVFKIWKPSWRIEFSENVQIFSIFRELFRILSNDLIWRTRKVRKISYSFWNDFRYFLETFSVKSNYWLLFHLIFQKIFWKYFRTT